MGPGVEATDTRVVELVVVVVTGADEQTNDAEVVTASVVVVVGEGT